MSTKRKSRIRCDWQKKNLSNYCTQSSTSPNLSDWWLHGFLNVFCVVGHSSVTSCTFPITLCPYKKNTGESGYAPVMTFYSPHQRPAMSTLTAGITIHYVSAGKGFKEPGRSSLHISLCRPVSKIITNTDKLPVGYFFLFIFYLLLLFSFFFSGWCFENTDPDFRAHVLFFVPHLK